MRAKKSSTAAVTPLVHQFPDKEQVLDILKDWSPREIRRFNKFMQDSKTSAVLDAYLYDSKSVNQRVGQTIVRLFKRAKNLSRGGWRDENFLKCAGRLIASDSIDDFEKLSVNDQQKVWKSYYSIPMESPVQGCTDRAFLRLLHMTGMPILDAEHAKSEARKYLENARALTRDKELPTPIDISDTTEGFVPSVINILNTNSYIKESAHYLVTGPVYTLKRVMEGISFHVFEPYGLQITLMLRALYGEQNVLDLLNRFEFSNQCLCPDEMIHLLQNWDKLCEYPDNWISQTEELEHVYS